MGKLEKEPRRLYPLVPCQHLIFLAWKFTLSKQVMNIPTVCLVDAPFDMAVLQKAAEQAVERHDSFGVRITKIGKERMQYFTERKVLSLEQIDFTGRPAAEMEAFFAREGCRKMKLDDSPLARIWLVRAPDGRCGVFTCISHLIMDSWGISVFYKDLMSLYFALKGEAPPPRPVGSFEKSIQKDLEYGRSDRAAADREFWKAEIAGMPEPPQYTHVSGLSLLEKVRRRKKDPKYPFGPTFMLRMKGAHEIIMVSREELEQMAAFCRQNGLSSPAQLFIMGMRTYLAKVNGRPHGVNVLSMVARRSTVEEKYSSGFRVHNLPLPAYMKEDDTFLDGLNAIMAKQNLYYRHADFDPLAVMSIQRQTWGYKLGESVTSVGITFQPVPMDLGNGLKVSTRWYCNGTSPQNLYLTIMDGDGTGALRCYYEYNTSTVTPETVRTCHAFMMKVIRAGIADPAISLKTLLNLPLGAEQADAAPQLAPALD